MWLPGYERHEYPGLAGKPYQFTHNPKGCMHTTEGGSIAGAMSAYAPYPPHLIYDWRNRRGVQHVRLDRASYSAMDGNDDDYMIQVELVGFAAETRFWPEQALRNIAADVVAPLEQYFKIPRRLIWHGFKDGRDGIVLAAPNSPIRLNWVQLRDFAGWLGHQHLPAPDDHWDPGALPVQRILNYLTQEAPDMDATERGWLKEAALRLRSMHTNGFNDVGEQARPMQGDLGWFQNQLKAGLGPLRTLLEQTLAAVTNDPDITPDAMRQIVDDATAKASRDQAAVIVQQIGSGISVLVEEALERVQAGDNAAEVEELLRRIGSLATPTTPTS